MARPHRLNTTSTPSDPNPISTEPSIDDSPMATEAEESDPSGLAPEPYAHSSPLPDNSYQRLSLPSPTRIATLTTLTFLSGAFIGGLHGSRTSALRFRAENAHRLPTTKQGWYFYHKTKNYVGAVGGVAGGLRAGCTFAVWVALFLTIEAAVDRLRGANRIDILREMAAAHEFGSVVPDAEVEWVIDREGRRGGRRDFLSTTVAALALAGGYNACTGFSYRRSFGMTKLGLAGGLFYGLLQDGVQLAKGNHLAWVDLLTGRLRRVQSAGSSDSEFSPSLNKT